MLLQALVAIRANANRVINFHSPQRPVDAARTCRHHTPVAQQTQTARIKVKMGTVELCMSLQEDFQALVRRRAADAG